MLAIVQRDVIRSLRRHTPFLLLFPVLIVVSLIVIAMWPEDGEPSMSDAATGSVAVVLGSTLALLLATLLTVPGYAASAILAEREQQTFELLATTLIRPYGLVLGKYLNVMSVVGIALAAVAPIVGVCFFLVGLDWTQLSVAGALVVLTASSCASLGVMISSLHTRVLYALISAYCLLFTVYGGPVFVVAVLLAIANSPFATTAILIGSTLCPLGAWAMLLEGIPGYGLGSLAMALCYHVALTAGALLIAYVRLRFPYGVPTAPAVAARRGRALLRAIVFGAPWSGRYRPVRSWANPMFAAEWRWGALTGKSARIRLGVAFGSLSVVSGLVLLGMSEFPGIRETAVVGMVMIQLAMVCFIAPAVLANSLTKEREYGNLDLLRTTLLSPWGVVTGKWLAGVFAMGPILVTGLLGHVILVPFYLKQPNLLGATIIGIASSFATAYLGVGIGILVSAVTRRTVVAVILSYAGLAAMVFGLFVGTTMLYSFTESVLKINLFGAWGPNNPVFESVLFLSPPGACLRSIVLENNAAVPVLQQLLSPYWVSNVVFHFALGTALAQTAVWWTARTQMTRGGAKL